MRYSKVCAFLNQQSDQNILLLVSIYFDYPKRPNSLLSTMFRKNVSNTIHAPSNASNRIPGYELSDLKQEKIKSRWINWDRPQFGTIYNEEAFYFE